jgi:hypothetical protein
MYQWSIIDPILEEDATATLVTKSPNDAGMASIEGSEDVMSQTIDHLSRSCGAFGHQINIESTTAIDIDAALSNFWLETKLIKGEIKNYDPEIEGDTLALT